MSTPVDLTLFRQPLLGWLVPSQVVARQERGGSRPCSVAFLSHVDVMLSMHAGLSLLFLFVPHSQTTCSLEHVFPAPATVSPRAQEFDDGLVCHVCLTPARSPMGGLCMSCRSSDAVQKVFIFLRCVLVDAVVLVAFFMAASNVCRGCEAATMEPRAHPSPPLRTLPVPTLRCRNLRALTRVAPTAPTLQ